MHYVSLVASPLHANPPPPPTLKYSTELAFLTGHLPDSFYAPSVSISAALWRLVLFFPTAPSTPLVGLLGSGSSPFFLASNYGCVIVPSLAPLFRTRPRPESPVPASMTDISSITASLFFALEWFTPHLFCLRGYYALTLHISRRRRPLSSTLIPPRGRSVACSPRVKICAKPLLLRSVPPPC